MLRLAGRSVRRWAFEAVPDPAEATHFDFLIAFSDRARVLVEVKLTEAEFGRCSADAQHLAKLRETYTPRLREKVPPSALSEEAFFANYQLFRSVSHLDLDTGDRLVLLVPRGNRVTWNQAKTFRGTFLTPGTRLAVDLFALEDVIPSLASSLEQGPPVLRTHVQLLSEKYLLPL